MLFETSLGLVSDENEPKYGRNPDRKSPLYVSNTMRKSTLGFFVACDGFSQAALIENTVQFGVPNSKDSIGHKRKEFPSHSACSISLKPKTNKIL